MYPDLIQKIKKRLNITNDLVDGALEDIYESVEKEYLLITKSNKVDESHDWILKEICIVRFNRLGDEGVSSSNIEGLSKNFVSKNGTDDFKPYMSYLVNNEPENNRAKGKVRFL